MLAVGFYIWPLLCWECCSSVTKLFPTLCDPVDWSPASLSFTVSQSLLKLSCPVSQWCHPNISSSVASPSPPTLNLSWYQGLFQWSLFCAHFLKSIYYNECWILSKAFSVSIEMIIWFLFFSLLLWYIILIYLWILKNTCSPGINPTWSWCMIRSTHCWVILLVLVFCWGFFH